MLNFDWLKEYSVECGYDFTDEQLEKILKVTLINHINPDESDIQDEFYDFVECLRYTKKYEPFNITKHLDYIYGTNYAEMLEN